MGAQQHRMEIKTLARDVAVFESLDNGNFRVIFKSPKGASKFSIELTYEHAMVISEGMYEFLMARKPSGKNEANPCNSPY